MSTKLTLRARLDLWGWSRWRTKAPGSRAWWLSTFSSEAANGHPVPEVVPVRVDLERVEQVHAVAWVADYTPTRKRALREAGCRFERHGKGDHEVWWSPISGRRFAVDAKIKSRHTANEVLRQAGLPKGF